MDMSHLIDRCLEAPAVVFGSLPPEGRDLDLVVTAPGYERTRAVLLDSGYQARGDSFAWFGSCSANGVDLHEIDGWMLGPEEALAFFDQALVITGYENLKRPAPHHQLLIAARRFVRSPVLSQKLRQRVAASIHERPSAWTEAERSAPSWRADRALALLRRAMQERGPDKKERAAALQEELEGRGLAAPRAAARAWKIVLRPPARGAAVSFSGLDGSGKTTQCEALRDSLEALGVDAVYSWTKIARDPILKRIATPTKKLLRRASTPQRRPGSAPASGAPAPLGSEDERAKQLSRSNPVIHIIWTTIVSVANANTQRRAVKEHIRCGRVVICDRYVLDTAAHLTFRYGKRNYRFQVFLNKLISPTPLRSYLLEVAPEEALRRKREQYDLKQLTLLARLYREEAEALGVRRLDGSAPAEELCASVAREVWQALR
jgi:thymidylate kinase